MEVLARHHCVFVWFSTSSFFPKCFILPLLGASEKKKGFQGKTARSELFFFLSSRDCLYHTHTCTFTRAVSNRATIVARAAF